MLVTLPNEETTKYFKSKHWINTDKSVYPLPKSFNFNIRDTALLTPLVVC